MAEGAFGKGGGIYAVYGTDARRMAMRLAQAAELGASVPAGAKIALKPNLVVSRPASEGATTHPDILAGVIEYLFDCGRRNIDIIEGSWLGDDTERAFAVCGIADLARRYGVGLHDLKRDAAVSVPTPAGPVRVCRKALEADFLVNLPVLKGHCQTRLTCAVKNMKGCLPDSEKRRFHQDGLDRWIAAMATVLRPGVTLVDGLCGDLDFEEGGNPVPADRMFLAADPVKMDAYACSLMGIPVEAVGYLPLAAEYGVGELAVRPGDVVHLNRPLPGGPPRASGKVGRLAGRVEADRACSACYANCIHALKRLEEAGRERPPLLCVGQGWRKREAPGLGIGDCCRGRLGNVPGCPPTARAIVDALVVDF